MTHGMVSAAQPEAAEAGADILRAGGNVVDAAIGAALVQTAVDPQMCGIAGMGCLHVYLPGRGVHTTLDFHGRAPAAARPDMWVDLIEREADDGWGFILQGRVNEIGYQSISTPMTLRAFDTALARWGTRGLGELLKPAIAYAEHGFLVRPHVSEFWHRPPQAGRDGNIGVVTRYPATRKIYTKSNGHPYAVGELLRNPDLAHTYRRIATHGAEDFYSGDLAGAHRGGHGGAWRAADTGRPRRLRGGGEFSLVGHLSRLAHRHQPSSRRRHPVDRDAEHPRAIRPARDGA